MKTVLGGGLESALWHFCGYGLTAIANRHGLGVSMSWVDDEPIRCHLHGASPEELAAAVLQHAKDAAQESHWVMAQMPNGVALFSPRTKPLAENEWSSYFDQRNEVLDGTSNLLDLEMILGLGQPAPWRSLGGLNQPDQGASRWEMQPRNGGKEFVTHRLRPLAKEIAGRTIEQIADGLTGKSIRDLNTKADSRTPSGLTTPRQTDAAVAWCGLWGISWFPTILRTGGMSQSPGVWPRSRVHPEQAVLPVLADPMPAEVWRQIIVSRQLDDVAFAKSDLVSLEADIAWLKKRSVVGLVRFPIEVRGTSAAPERVLLDGDLMLFE